MKGIRFFVVFLVLSVYMLSTAEAGRSRTSNQNSFRRAANGIYQTLSSVFGEDNIRGLYKVSVGDVTPGLQLVCSMRLRVANSCCFVVRVLRTKRAGAWPIFHGCHFEKLAVILH